MREDPRGAVAGGPAEQPARHPHGRPPGGAQGGRPALRQVQALVSAFLRIRIDENYPVRAVHRVATHQGPAYGETRKQVREAGVASAGETGRRASGMAAWLRGFVTRRTVVLAVEASRGG